MKSRPRFFLSLAAALAAPLLTAAQQPSFRSAIDVVSMNVTVTDATNRYVTDLTEKDFEIYEDGVKQDLTLFNRTNLPVALSLLIDTSSSMEDRMATAQDAAIGFALFTLMMSQLVQSKKYNKVKLEPYECGIEPTTDARDRYSIRYYLVAMLFVIFDVETVFLFPWAVIVDELALFGLIEMIVFLAILVTGYAYAWKKGALDWA